MDRALESEVEIAHVIYERHRKAHRTQLWWKYFSMVHRRMCHIAIRGSLPSGETHFLVKKLIPKAARSVHSMLAHGTFVSLGFTILAVLSRFYVLLLPHLPEPKQAIPQRRASEPVETSQADTNEPQIRLEDAVVVKPKTRKKQKKARRNAIDAIFG